MDTKYIVEVISEEDSSPNKILSCSIHSSQISAICAFKALVEQLLCGKDIYDCMDWYNRGENRIDRAICFWGIVNGKVTKVQVIIKVTEVDHSSRYICKMFSNYVS